jgi:hypothetical protein
VLHTGTGRDVLTADDAVDLFGSGPWECYRCDHVFVAYPCPHCASYDISISPVLPGSVEPDPSRFLRCRGCGEEFLSGA